MKSLRFYQQCLLLLLASSWLSALYRLLFETQIILPPWAVVFCWWAMALFSVIMLGNAAYLFRDWTIPLCGWFSKSPSAYDWSDLPAASEANLPNAAPAEALAMEKFMRRALSEIALIRGCFVLMVVLVASLVCVGLAIGLDLDLITEKYIWLASVSVVTALDRRQ